MSGEQSRSDANEGQHEMEDDHSSEMPAGWIPWFCNVPGHEFFCEVDEDYIRDNFNLYGLRNRVQYYEHALEMILMREAPDEDDLQDADFLEVYRDAQDLYGLVHARYIISPRGLEVMRDLYIRGIFGTCPRVMCSNQHVLPVGTSDELRVSRVKTYCPRCEQLYATKSKYSDVDGAYFGTSFPHIFCLTFPGIIPLDPPVPYIPKLFGFRISQPTGLIERHLEGGDKKTSTARQEGTPVQEEPARTQAPAESSTQAAVTTTPAGQDTALLHN